MVRDESIGCTLDMLQAMNTSHEGSLTTLHANTVRDALARLETLVLKAGMESGKIQMQEIFRFHNQGYTGPNNKVSGIYTGCGMVPTFYDELRATGRDLDVTMFMPADLGLIDQNGEVVA
jgi:pilus assembly protein CpaF